MDAVKYFKERERMLESLGKTEGKCGGVSSCSTCFLHPNGKCLYNDVESVAIVEKWSKEHPQKTMLQDFLEKYPNARLNTDGTPHCCPTNLGYIKDPYCKWEGCLKCWNRPLEG